MHPENSIFISYRRDDSADITGRIFDWLSREFPKRVFKDVDSIPFGVNFRKHIKTALERCGVMIVVIGKNWLDIREDDGTRRLDNPVDYVRVEIETILQRQPMATVIPVLVSGSEVPLPHRLPESLRSLSDFNAAQLRRDPDFKPDMGRLIAQLRDLLDIPGATVLNEDFPAVQTTEAELPKRQFDESGGFFTAPLAGNSSDGQNRPSDHDNPGVLLTAAGKQAIKRNKFVAALTLFGATALITLGVWLATTPRRNALTEAQTTKFENLEPSTPNPDDQQDVRIRRNLQEITFAAAYYFHNEPTSTDVTFDELVKREFISDLAPVTGESYKGLRVHCDGGELRVVSKLDVFTVYTYGTLK